LIGLASTSAALSIDPTEIAHEIEHLSLEQFVATMHPKLAIHLCSLLWNRMGILRLAMKSPFRRQDVTVRTNGTRDAPAHDDKLP
jgi:hypothetical protein